ncbi:MAG: chorismate synthase [Clostridia bacterium]|nr:chorismate synthase [Clostridia bacterium]
MKNSFGSAISVTLFGESHGAAVGAVIDGLAPGVRVDEEYISARLDERRAFGDISTKRRESDKFEILSGVFNGYTTGTPITVIIRNEDVSSKDYSSLLTTPRPSHADYVASEKYHGYQDYRGGGHFSGRITAALVAAGAIIRRALLERGIFIGTHIKRLYDLYDRDFSELSEDIKTLSKTRFPVLDGETAEKMTARIKEIGASGDSVGGILETAIIGVPVGVGEPWFDTVEGILSHALFSVPAIKGVEFGEGFGFAGLLGSEANDPFCVRDGRVLTKTNRSGGVNGGITNGMPITFRCAVKPTPSIYKEQDTVDLNKMQDAKLTVVGRHDPAIIHRARAVVDAVAAIAIADMLTVRYGTDYLAKD